MAMWLQIVALVHISFQATSYARSLDTSVVLDRLISSSIRNHHPVIIVINPPKSLLPDFENDDTTNEYENENVLQLIPSLRSHNHNVESCKQFLRQKLNSKCSNEANCSEVVWDIADQICDDKDEDADDKKQTVDEDGIKIKNEGTVETSSTPRKNRTSTRPPRITRPQ